ncbi:hypothetical protein Scep_018920 [Stephania cephalantha]|uniref:Uncharacterized protein n=1 Tax=Stephania cephalantha TaxID=152367 RepID=A0AAP0NPB5_9MAGN
MSSPLPTDHFTPLFRVSQFLPIHLQIWEPPGGQETIPLFSRPNSILRSQYSGPYGVPFHDHTPPNLY